MVFCVTEQGSAELHRCEKKPKCWNQTGEGEEKDKRWNWREDYLGPASEPDAQTQPFVAIMFLKFPYSSSLPSLTNTVSFHFLILAKAGNENMEGVGVQYFV